jgi:CxxC-x17-CxxC domain-containing protein
MFQATCAECGSACEVPFKPNGSKPVLCNNCFKRDSGSQPSRFGGDRGDRKPSFNSGFAPKPSFDRPASGGANMDKLEDQLRGINTKLEAVLNALNAMNGSKAASKKEEAAPAKKEAAPAKAAPAEKPVKAAKEKKAVKKKK